MSKRTLEMIAKAGLLFIILGFFQPIACNLNGFELIDTLREAGEVGSVAHVVAWLLIGLFSISIVALLLLLFRVNKLPLDWILVASSIATGLASYLMMRGKEQWEYFFLRLIMGRGVTFIIIGWALSGIALLVASFLPQEQKPSEATTLPNSWSEEDRQS